MATTKQQNNSEPLYIEFSLPSDMVNDGKDLNKNIQNIRSHLKNINNSAIEIENLGKNIQKEVVLTNKVLDELLQVREVKESKVKNKLAMHRKIDDVHLSDDGRLITHKGSCQSINVRAINQLNETNGLYFEADFKNIKSAGIGVGTKEFPLDANAGVGRVSKSFGLSSSGALWSEGVKQRKFSYYGYGVGDTVGCGVEFSKQLPVGQCFLYFTRNGIIVGENC
uniref:SPRY domain-containing protein n=1 Tax=Meloidogyne hapla TaxID=6305 RepID=A0A1I8BUI4_MELHA